MSARSFRSVFMVASCAGAALGCYLVSLRVASERSQLEDVENRIVLAQQDMRVLQTEIGTRGRLAQLERWNVKVLALSAPAAQQFVSGGYELAKLTRNQPTVDFQAPVVMASAPAPQHTPAMTQEPRDDSGATPQATDPASPRTMLHEASYRIETPEVAQPVRAVAAKTVQAKPAAVKRATAVNPAPAAATAKPVAKKSVDKPLLALTRPVTKPIRIAKNDPLAPLAGKPLKKTVKDTGSAR
jgi:hypothetical protein